MNKYIVSSKDVTDSGYVSFSRRVNNSEIVTHSSEVSNSNQIYFSDGIRNSIKVYTSSIVTNSSYVKESKNITESHNIVDSSVVIDSSNVIGSYNVLASKYIRDCTGVTDSAFCVKSKDLVNCLFCHDVQGGDYYLFNKPIDSRLFYVLMDQLKNFGDIEANFCTWPQDFEIRVPVTRPFTEYYKNLDESFLLWAKTLPGYDESLMFKITGNINALG